MKLRYVLVFIILFVAVICLSPFLIDMLHRMSVRNKGGYRKTLTLARFCDLAVGIYLLVEDTNEPPPKEIKAFSEYVKSHFYVFGHENQLTEWFDANTGTITDDWGTPVNLATKIHREYTFISAGPNRVHENCKGDDIVYTFDPFDHNKKPEIIIGGKTLKLK